jgi:hypothetical protein
MTWSIRCQGKTPHETIAEIEKQAQAIDQLHPVESQLRHQAVALTLATIGSQSPRNIIDVEVIGIAKVVNDEHAQNIFINVQAVIPPLPPPPEKPKKKAKGA